MLVRVDKLFLFLIWFFFFWLIFFLFWFCLILHQHTWNRVHHNASCPACVCAFFVCVCVVWCERQKSLSLFFFYLFTSFLLCSSITLQTSNIYERWRKKNKQINSNGIFFFYFMCCGKTDFRALRSDRRNKICLFYFFSFKIKEKNWIEINGQTECAHARRAKHLRIKQTVKKKTNENCSGKKFRRRAKNDVRGLHTKKTQWMNAWLCLLYIERRCLILLARSICH